MHGGARLEEVGGQLHLRLLDRHPRRRLGIAEQFSSTSPSAGLHDELGRGLLSGEQTAAIEDHEPPVESLLDVHLAPSVAATARTGRQL